MEVLITICDTLWLLFKISIILLGVLIVLGLFVAMIFDTCKRVKELTNEESKTKKDKK